MSFKTTSLKGVHTEPLSEYLKAIGVLRVLGDQVDAKSTGWWTSDGFVLASPLDAEELVRFFLRDYQPTPLIAPWNGGSGFFAADRKGAWHKGFERMMNSKAKRFADYRDAITVGQRLLGERSEKFEAQQSQLKEEFLRKCRASFRGRVGAWIRAAMSINAEGSPVYPALLGTGGNDGRLDFTNNFMQRIAELFDVDSDDGTPRPHTESFFREALFENLSRGMQSAPIGQFSPGAAGGVNSGHGFQDGAQINPVDFILMLEGAIAFTPAIVRRNATSTLPQAAAPFAVYSGIGGHATAVAEEKSRGEQWMPLWEQPTSYQELSKVLGEARCRVAGHHVERPRDVAQAIARCGVARGITGFQRFAFLERNGQANLAVSLGRWHVAEKVRHSDILPELDRWLDLLERAARGKTSPQCWSNHARVINDRIMDCCRSNASSSTWQRLLMALGNAEADVLKNPKAVATARLIPLAGLSPRWIIAAGDGSPELRLAVALASQCGPRREEKKPIERNLGDPLRRHWMPLKQTEKACELPHRFAMSDESLANLVEVVAHGSDLVRDLIAIVQRRLQMLEQRNDWHHLPIVPLKFLSASYVDVWSWINEELDDSKIVALTRSLMAIDWKKAWDLRDSLRSALGLDHGVFDPDTHRRAAWAAIRLCFHWKDVELSINNSSNPQDMLTGKYRITTDPAIFHNLIGGRSQVAIELASRRLRASGVPVNVGRTLVEHRTSQRFAASFAWSLSDESMLRLTTPVIHRAGLDSEPKTLHEAVS